MPLSPRATPTRALKLAFGAMLGGAFLLAGALFVLLNALLFPDIPFVTGLVIAAGMALLGGVLMWYGIREREAEMARQGFRFEGAPDAPERIRAP